MSLSEKAKTTEWIWKQNKPWAFLTLETNHPLEKAQEDFLKFSKQKWVPLETAQQLEAEVNRLDSCYVEMEKCRDYWKDKAIKDEAKIAEALKILNEFDPELMLPIMGKPAVFRVETEYEKGEAEGYYCMRRESLKVLDEIKKRLRGCLAGDETKP